MTTSRVFQSATQLGLRVMKALGITRWLGRQIPRLPDKPRNWLLLHQSEHRARTGRAIAQYPDQALVPVKQLERAYRDALRLLTERSGPDSLGNYLEFGVYAGASLACMHRASSDLRLERMRLFGFDSFEGLPSSVDDYRDTPWQPGQFATNEGEAREYLARQGVRSDRVTLVKGWFEETLIPELAREQNIVKASVIMVDCDVYSSAKTALEFCAPLIGDEAVIFFDDWWPDTLGKSDRGEKRAFEDFLESNPSLMVTELDSYYPKAAKVFLVSRQGALEEG